MLWAQPLDNNTFEKRTSDTRERVREGFFSGFLSMAAGYATITLLLLFDGRRGVATGSLLLWLAAVGLIRRTVRRRPRQQ